MNRLEKLILEQIKTGDLGIRRTDGPLAAKTSKYITNPKDRVTSFYYVDQHGGRKKYPPLTVDELVQIYLPRLKPLQKYNTKDYIVILDTTSQTTNKTQSTWEVFVVTRNSLKNIPESDITILGNIGSAPLIDLSEFQKLKKQNDLVKTKQKTKTKTNTHTKQVDTTTPDQQKQKTPIGTETIDPNNLGKGTPDAKAFQELLWQYGNKYETQKELPVYTKFAEYRTQGADGGWDGKIGPATKNYITFLYGGLKVNTYPELIKKIRSDLSQVQTESTNYFKGIGMNIKLKDILREQLLKEQEGFDFSAANAAIGAGTTTSATKKKASTNTRVSRSKIFTPDTFPSNYTGKGKITYNSGDTFTGSWENGKKSGQGTYKSKDGTTYNGTWSNGKMTGEFTIEYSNGNIRVGTYNSNGLNGTVTFTKKDGEPVQETWKDGVKIKSNKEYWDIVKKWVQDEYNFWENGGSGPEGQKNPLTHRQMFKQFNHTWDDEEGLAKRAYMLNRKIALKWLKKQLEGDYTYYTKIENWIYDIGDQIDDYFQNDVTITLRNDNEGEIFTRTVQPEIDV